ncbi:lipoprotein [Spiroplasma ixodetis]|uniref:lipoprotein n=1 Tax=Spiroplasma ixodetis TaxID=2141 RepID=UPI002578A9AD|nr:lipoprotein [Spiroplasma ixodetis]WJG70996.1 hypothetical protein SIXOD_v1c22990 [Spiroplasma ixodetis Y32]
MKKLLSMLGTITLIGTASTNVIACGGEKPTPPAPDIRTDINGKITSPIDLGQLDENTKNGFLTKLQTKLVTLSGLSTITNNDYNVYKAGTTTALHNSDVTAGTSLNIKIVAKGNNFKGEKDSIIVNYTKKNAKTDLNTEMLKTNLKFTKTMNGKDAYNELRSKIKDLSNNIYNSTDEIKNDNTLLISIWISSSQQLEDTSTSNLETLGSVDVKIKVSENNKAFKECDWKVLSGVIVNKTNLNIITKLTGLNITADINKIYDDFWDNIFQANELKDNNSIRNNWSNWVFASNNPSDTTNIKSQKQQSGTIYIVISADNQYWTGITPRLKVTLA